MGLMGLVTNRIYSFCFTIFVMNISEFNLACIVKIFYVVQIQPYTKEITTENDEMYKVLTLNVRGPN